MAGARKSRHSKHGRSKRERYGQRSVATRSPLPIVVIVCDDTVTAPAYFAELQRLCKQHVTLRVVPASHKGASPPAVVDQAMSEHAELEKPAGDENDTNIVWAVLDLEREGNRRKQAETEKKRAEGGGVKVALSNPCYEVWTLLHLEDTGEHFENCGKVLNRVKKAWKEGFGQAFGPKAQADFSKIIDLRQKSAKRAKQHQQNDDPSWTEVYKITEDIEAIVQAAGAKYK